MAWVERLFNYLKQGSGVALLVEPRRTGSGISAPPVTRLHRGAGAAIPKVSADEGCPVTLALSLHAPTTNCATRWCDKRAGMCSEVLDAAGRTRP
ncbi:hypothetical protein GCM10020220_066110 [Nonomuraea rubra]